MTQAPRVIAAVCGECETQVRATHKPDFCGACHTVGGPWVLAVQWSALGGVVRAGVRFRLAGAWTAEARAQAVVDLGSMLEGG